MVALPETRIATAPRPHDDVWIPSVCRMCNNGCGIRLHRVNGVVVQIVGNPDNPHNFGRICAKGLSAIMSHYDPDRLRQCLRRTNPRKGPGEDPGWQEVSWEEATGEVVARLRQIRAEDPRQLMFVNGIAEVDMPRAVAGAFAAAFGTPNFTTGVFFGTHTRASYLNNGSMHSEPDLEHCRLLVLFGSQKGAGMGHDTMKSALALAEARSRGMKLVVLDPMCSAMASKADEWVPLIPGTDGAVALAMLHVLLNEANLIDGPFLVRETNAAYLVGPSGQYVRDAASGKPLVWDGASGAPRIYDDPSVGNAALSGDFSVEGECCRPALDLLRRHAAQFPPERVEAISTVPAATVRRLALEFGRTALAGGRVVIDGVELPLRPACAFPDSRGSTCHAQGLWTGTAIELLNVVVGAADVPGGNITSNAMGPHGRLRVKEGPDGVIATTVELPGGESQYPGRAPRPPETVQLHELFPIGRQPRPMLGLTLLDYPQLLPYRPEMLVIWGSNVLASGADPRRMAQAFEKIPLVVGLGERMDETLECADLVFPTPSHLERLDFPMNGLEGWVTGRHWYFAARQPACAPPAGVRHTVDIFLEWAEHLGLIGAVHERLNARLGLAEDFRLEPDRRYANDEIVERRMQSMFGADHDRAWFRERGLVAWERTLPERYPRPLGKLPRLPVYFPHLLERGQELKEVTQGLGIAWDLSLYEAVPIWQGCWSHRARQPEQLYAINYKLAFETSTTTQGNPWLMDLARRHRLALYATINSETARRLGIADGDEIEITGTNGYTAHGLARVAQGVHPDVVAIASCFGHWTSKQPVSRGRGIHYNSLIPLSIQGMEMLTGDYDACALVTLRRAG